MKMRNQISLLSNRSLAWGIERLLHRGLVEIRPALVRHGPVEEPPGRGFGLETNMILLAGGTGAIVPGAVQRALGLPQILRRWRCEDRDRAYSRAAMTW